MTLNPVMVHFSSWMMSMINMAVDSLPLPVATHPGLVSLRIIIASVRLVSQLTYWSASVGGSINRPQLVGRSAGLSWWADQHQLVGRLVGTGVLSLLYCH